MHAAPATVRAGTTITVARLAGRAVAPAGSGIVGRKVWRWQRRGVTMSEEVFVPSSSCTVASGDCLMEGRCLGRCPDTAGSSARCVVDDPLCPSRYDGCECPCDFELDAKFGERMRIRAQNAERVLLRLVIAVRRNRVTDDLLHTAARIATQPDED
uniref:Uncharacterized protein n=1 Tax=Burkholderia sp. M701 TaxID=326454 RepID=V5YP17_9BURK|nr:hypothetical protein [Burkholderia sp. M701]